MKHYKEKMIVSLDAVEVKPFQLDEETKSVLMAGQELSEETTNEIVTVFEAAVNSKVAEIVKEVAETYDTAFGEKVNEVKEEITQKVSTYLEDEVVAEWMKENKLAIEQGIVQEHNEKFITGMVELMKEHYVSVPEDRKDLMEELGNEVLKLRDSVKALKEESAKKTNELNGNACKAVVEKLAEGLSESDVEKFESLVGDFAIDDPSKFEEKARIVREKFFNESKVADKEPVTEETKAPATNTTQLTSIQRAAAMLGGARKSQ